MTDRAQATGGWIAIIGAIVPVISAFAFYGWAANNQIGPRWFWSQDACPDPEVTCGVFPASLMVGILIGIVAVIALFYALDHAGGEAA